MVRSFRLKTFLRYINAELLQAFLKFVGVESVLPQPQKDQDEVDVWVSFISSLEKQKSIDIETTLRDVNELASDGGTIDLVDVANGQGVELGEGFRAQENEYERALYCLVYHKNVFENAFVFQHVNELKYQMERRVKPCPAADVMPRKDDLANALKTYFFSKELRGQNCQVDVFNDHDKKVCFIAYPEDHPKTDLFYEGGRLTRKSRRPTFRVVYVYECATGKLELNARGGWQKKLALMNIFNKEVLKDDHPVAERDKIYNLAKFLEKDFEFATKPEDEIEYVNLLELTVKHKQTKDLVTIELENSDGMEDMREALQYHKITADQFWVARAKIQIKFPPMGRQKGSVTFHLIWQDRCDLGESYYHLKAKEYVKYWNLEEKPIIARVSEGNTKTAEAVSA